jgi:amino acid transporter
MRQTCFKQHSTSKWFVFVAGFLTFINSYDVKLTTRIQNVFMFTKVAALGVIIIAGFAYLFMGK